MRFLDHGALDGAIRRTSDGYAVFSAKVARAGNVQLYLGSELGITDKQIVRIYRPAEEVFKKDALASYSGVPITVEHPKDSVTADNWKKLAVGEVGEEILRDGDFVRVPMMLRDADAIKAVEDGKRELSAGYDAEVIMTPGTSPAGEVYDGFMANYKFNHVAIVDRARGGSELRIGDGAVNWGASPVNPADEKETPMADTLRKMLVDGLQVETTEAGAQAIDKLQSQLRDSAAKIGTLTTEHQNAIAAKDGIIAKKDEEIGALKAEVKTLTDAKLKPADIDKLVTDRVALVGIVRAMDSTIEIAGKSDDELRIAVVKSKLGDVAVTKDTPLAEINGMFRALTKDVKPGEIADPLRSTIEDGVHSAGVGDKASNDAYAAMVKDMQTAYLPATAKH